MKKDNKSHVLNLGLVVATLFLAACGSEEKEVSQNQADSNQLDSIRLLNTKPEGSVSVKAAREQLKPGDAALVMGQVGGTHEPFLEGYAGFVLADTNLAFCNESGDDHCPTPWDACCEDPDKVKASRVSVQFVDSTGEPLLASVEGFAGLQGLSHVVVSGTIAEGSTAENLVINANELYVGE